MIRAEPFVDGLQAAVVADLDAIRLALLLVSHVVHAVDLDPFGRNLVRCYCATV